MNTKSKTFLKTMRVAFIVLALTFSSNMNAATTASSGGGVWEWIKELFNPKKSKAKNNKSDNNQTSSNQKGSDSVPLDGGLGILLLGAAAFGVKKLRESKNEEA